MTRLQCMGIGKERGRETGKTTKKEEQTRKVRKGTRRSEKRKMDIHSDRKGLEHTSPVPSANAAGTAMLAAAMAGASALEILAMMG